MTKSRLANGMTNPYVCRPSVFCLSSLTCVHPTEGFNFSGISLHHFVAWPSATHPPKISKIVQGDHPSEQIFLTGVWLCDSSKVAKLPQPACIIKSRLAISSPDEFLVSTWQLPISRNCWLLHLQLHFRFLIQLTKERVVFPVLLMLVS